MWNCWPERYGKFQSEIPSTSGAICEKPQGVPLGPPAGRGLNGNKRNVETDDTIQKSINNPTSLLLDHKTSAPASRCHLKKPRRWPGWQAVPHYTAVMRDSSLLQPGRTASSHEFTQRLGQAAAARHGAPGQVCGSQLH